MEDVISVRHRFPKGNLVKWMLASQLTNTHGKETKYFIREGRDYGRVTFSVLEQIPSVDTSVIAQG